MSDSDKPVDQEGEAPTIEVSEAEPAVTTALEPACMDLIDHKPKVDHFENIHVLPEAGKIEGAPNFRQVCLYLYVYNYECLFFVTQQWVGREEEWVEQIDTGQQQFNLK